MDSESLTVLSGYFLSAAGGFVELFVSSLALLAVFLGAYTIIQILTSMVGWMFSGVMRMFRS